MLNVGWFPHSVMQQARTHRVVSFDVQSMRYTGERICRSADGELELEEVFYLRPVGDYSDRQGKKYTYSEALRSEDLRLCRQAAERYGTCCARIRRRTRPRASCRSTIASTLRCELQP